MTQISWNLQPSNRAGGYIVTNTDWNDVAGDLRAFIDQTTSSASDNTPLPIGIDLVNDRVYISDPDSTTPEDANHADTTLSVVGTTTLAGNTQQTGTFTVGVDDTGHDVKFFGATSGTYLLWDEDQDELTFVAADLDMDDASVIRLGTGDDLQIFANGSHSFIDHDGDGDLWIRATHDDDELYLEAGDNIILRTGATPANRVWVTTAGNVGINTDAPVGLLDVNGTIHFGNGTNRYINYRSGNADIIYSFDSGDFYLQDITNSIHWFYTGNSPRFTISDSVVNCVGEFTAGTKTFDIAHPTKGGDWRLRHASIEGPRHDLIYRGTVTLSGGTATVDLDTTSNMTDGTWEALCRDPWAMVASSGNAVEWVLDGKTLTVTSDTADAVCSWMVMAERHDPQVYSEAAPSADNDGHFITEFEREASPPPAPPEEAEEAA